MNKTNFCVILALLIILSSVIISCSPKKKYRIGDNDIHTEKLFNQTLIKTILYNQYFEWNGTPYKNGGMSKKGIDCSGLVFLTFKNKLGVELPRTTVEQANIGKQVRRDNLLAGDLVFFKTGFWNHHVGIFLDGNSFLHTSTSRGVIISSLNDQYWKENYYLAKRIDFN